jgi:hypothetical protein
LRVVILLLIYFGKQKTTSVCYHFPCFGASSRSPNNVCLLFSPPVMEIRRDSVLAWKEIREELQMFFYGKNRMVAENLVLCWLQVGVAYCREDVLPSYGKIM